MGRVAPMMTISLNDLDEIKNLAGHRSHLETRRAALLRKKGNLRSVLVSIGDADADFIVFEEKTKPRAFSQRIVAAVEVHLDEEIASLDERLAAFGLVVASPSA